MKPNAGFGMIFGWMVCDKKNIQVAFQWPKLQLVKVYIQRPWGTLADRQIDRVKPSA